MRMTALSFMAPTATMESGHRSRSSKTHGHLKSRETTYAAHGVKNCGEVEIVTSGRGRKGAASITYTMKLA